MNRHEYDFIANTELKKFITGEVLKPVMKDGKWGLVNDEGRCKFACRHDSIPEQITSDTIKLKRHGLYGVRNFDGDVIIDFVYKSIEAVKRHAYSHNWDKDSYVGYIVQETDGKFGVLSVSGNEIIPCEYEKISYKGGQGVYLVVKNGKQGLKDINGKTCMPTRYFNVRKSAGSLYVVLDRLEREGLYDVEHRKIVCSPKYYHIGAFVEELAPVKNEQCRWGFVNMQGKEQIKCKYSAVTDFANGYAAVQDEYGNWGYIDAAGNNVTGFVYSKAGRVNKDKVACVEYIDQATGKTIAGKKYF